MHIAAGDHRNSVTNDPVIARENIGGHIHACDVSKMWLAVDVRPGDAD